MGSGGMARRAAAEPVPYQLLNPAERMTPRGADGASVLPAAGDAAARVRAGGVLPAEVRRGRRAARRLPQPGRPGALPVHQQGRPARQLPVRDVRRPTEQSGGIHASSGTTGRPTVVGYTEHDLSMLGRVVARSIRAAGGRPGRQGARGLRLRAVHRRARRALRRRAARLHGDPGLRRHDRAPGAADPGLRAGDHHGHAVLHAHAPRRVRAAGRRPARHVAAGRDLRRRAVDRGDARARSRSGSRSTRSTSTACRR